MACIHGSDPATCVVCQTLAELEAPSGKLTRGRRSRTAVPVEIVDRHPRARGGRSFGFHVVVVLAVVLAAAISVWVVVGVVFAVIHLIEVVAVAAAAGTLGYRLGRARGRRER